MKFKNICARVTLFRSRKILLFWKVLVGSCVSSALSQIPVIHFGILSLSLHSRLHRLRISIFFQNKITSTTLTQMTKDERLHPLTYLGPSFWEKFIGRHDLIQCFSTFLLQRATATWYYLVLFLDNFLRALVWKLSWTNQLLWLGTKG